MNVLKGIRQRAAARPAHIVLSEGHDPRIVEGALAAVRSGIARVTLVGPEAQVQTQLDRAGGGLDGISIEDPASSPLTAEFARTYFDLRRQKGVSEDVANTQAHDPLIFAAMMVRNGHAEGSVGGAVATSSATLSAALQFIGKSPQATLVSSFFVMALPDGHPSGRSGMIFADCGLVIAPDAGELAAIAAASAVSCQQLLGETPKVALLSFSTLGSARHASVTKVAEAADILRRHHPDIDADGELQFDAAFAAGVGTSKAPGSSVAGRANVMIFPDLNSGNIGYKIAQRIGGCDAIGPVLQGLAKPANDLSRGCTAQDVTNMIAVTVLQAGASSA